ncbi:MAG: ATP-binding protein [Myxococcota bacterium]|nr:ATP-binding protein [Myxococcota bacterium]
MRIDRKPHVDGILRRLRDFPVVAIVGARQVGKTTLAGQVGEAWRRSPTTTFDLESPADLARLDDPLRALQDLRGLVVLDEVQHLPEVFRVLRVLADRPRRPARFLVLGSASPELLQQSSESLAGRIAYCELGGLRLDEVGPDRLSRLWLRGGFPRAYLAASNARSSAWRDAFIRSFLERDLPQLGIRIASATLRRFWNMLAHYHGQVWNASELGRALGADYKTVQRYLDVLTSTFVTRALRPYHANIRKRQVKSPKVYVADSGLLHTLLRLESLRDLEGHPKVGASWEGFLLDQVCRLLDVPDDQAYFWATHGGAEIDLVVERGRRLHGFEFKRTVSPQVTASMHTALDELGLESLTVVHAGRESFVLRRGVRAVSAMRMAEDLQAI